VKGSASNLVTGREPDHTSSHSSNVLIKCVNIPFVKGSKSTRYHSLLGPLAIRAQAPVPRAFASAWFSYEFHAEIKGARNFSQTTTVYPISQVNRLNTTKESVGNCRRPPEIFVNFCIRRSPPCRLFLRCPLHCRKVHLFMDAQAGGRKASP
jgi:hypothetical protein